MAQWTWTKRKRRYEGGQAPCFAVMHAAMAITSGLAHTVVVYGALNRRSGERVGSRLFPAPTALYRYPIGVTAHPQLIAMWARRFMAETGVLAVPAESIPEGTWYEDRRNFSGEMAR